MILHSLPPRRSTNSANTGYPEKKDEQQETSTKRFELPMKRDDHTPEALGRFLASKYHEASTQYGGGTRVTHAKFFRTLTGPQDGPPWRV